MNNTKRLVVLGSGVLGATGIGLLSAGQAQAATTAEVNYTDGATTVWTSPTTGQTAKRYIFKGQSVNLLASQKIGAETWYRIGNGEWVPARYLTTTDQPVATETTATQETARIAYAEGATTVWSTPTYTAPTGRYLTYGQTEGITKTQTVAGETWYQLANGGWIPARYTGQGRLKATPVVEQTTTPVATPTSQPTTEKAAAPVTDTTPAAATSSTATAATGSSVAESTPAQATTSSVAEVASQSAPSESAATESTSSSQVTTSESTASVVETATSESATSTTPVVETPKQESVVESNTTSQPTTDNQQQNNNNNQTNNNQNNNNNQPATPSTPTPAPTTPSTTGNAQSVINLAMAQIGKPYVWGAKGPSSFDCSGLMNYVFKQAAGRDIGGWTVPQESAGYTVSLSNLQPGDLLFWGAPGSSYHVALYIGGGQYIHAPQPGENVKIGSMQYYAPQFAKRVF